MEDEEEGWGWSDVEDGEISQNHELQDEGDVNDVVWFGKRAKEIYWAAIALGRYLPLNQIYCTYFVPFIINQLVLRGLKS